MHKAPASSEICSPSCAERPASSSCSIGLGSTDRLTDTSASVTDSYIYQAFGSIRASTGTSANPFRFVGRSGYYFNQDLLDYYLLVRVLNPVTGRFSSADPLGFGAADSNPYRYAQNDPPNLIDPSGEDCVVLDTKKMKQDEKACAKMAKNPGCKRLKPQPMPDPKTKPGLLGLTFCANGRIDIRVYGPPAGQTRSGSRVQSAFGNASLSTRNTIRHRSARAAPRYARAILKTHSTSAMRIKTPRSSGNAPHLSQAWPVWRK